MKKSLLLSLLSFCLLTFSSTALSVADIGGVYETHLIIVKTGTPFQFSIPDKYVGADQHLNTPMTIGLTSVNQQKVYSTQIASLSNIALLSDLKSGTYYVTVQVGNFSETQKWVY